MTGPQRDMTEEAATESWDTPGRLRMLVRAVARRCLLCGNRGIFSGWFKLRDRCVQCGYVFEREEGYWVGAMIVNIGGAEAAFLMFFVGSLTLTWPDPPWTALMISGLTLMAAFPIVFYPWSKMLWLWGDIAIRGPTPDRQ